MPDSIPSHVAGLLAYLSRPEEKANEDQALTYFRKLFGDSFTRQQEAKRADGYVPGHFVLELKGDTKDWLSGLFQGLAYRRTDLDFSQIVVAAKSFLAIWNVEDLPETLRDEVLSATGAPHSIGKLLAKKYSSQKPKLLRLAAWNGGVELSGGLFLSQPELILTKFRSFETTLREGRKVRERVTLKNFEKVLQEMTHFFEPGQPIKAVRAFYSMTYAWTNTSTLQLSHKAHDQAALGGEVITNLRPASRERFKEFVENRAVFLNPGEDNDDFFARFDKALDAVDRGFRIKHGIFFTDLDLSRFVMWFIKRDIPELGKNYLVIDPACGSGNLVTNWRSPLELRHKVVSEIEPELLFAVEKRMKGDQWHNGKFTVIPKVAENKGLNFLDRSAAHYLNEIKAYLGEKGLKPDKPLAFLCNPPYRSDDDQTTGAAGYRPHSSVLEVTGSDAANERYCCFLAQMKLICDTAESSGLPGDSLLLLFTKSAWLTKRPIFKNIRSHMLGVFQDCGGVLVNGQEFFDVKGSWPVAFTVWRYKGPEASLDPHRSIPLTDLTWLKKEQLAQIPWATTVEMERGCSSIISDARSRVVEIGQERISIREWSGQLMTDFKRDRRKQEKNARIVGGLPLNDDRHNLKKAHGASDGLFIGFMDNLTPCRVKKSTSDRPWFYLDSRFMSIRQARCLSGPPTHLGYCAANLASAKKLFFWYALARTFLQERYPMWIDSDNLWAPTIPSEFQEKVFQTAFAIGYAENECVETKFPANNPLAGSPEINVNNPMTPLNPDSFWSTTLRPCFNSSTNRNTTDLLMSVDALFSNWRKLSKSRNELPLSDKPYFISDGKLTIGAGIVQIKDYATDNEVESLLTNLRQIQERLRLVKSDFFKMVTAKTGLDYFGAQKKNARREFALPQKTRFERILAKRLALAGIIVHRLNRDPNFGRTKFSKLFYLADTHEGLNLETQYYREAAGPLDPRALYNATVGIESLAQKHRVFTPEPRGGMVRYRPAEQLDELVDSAQQHLGAKTENVRQLAELFRKLDTDQSEIVATLYACWNDLLLRKRNAADEDIVNEFVYHWHPKKARFPKRRLLNALEWMRENNLTPKGLGKPTAAKPGPTS